MRREECFGELSLLAGSNRSASAIALEASEVVVIPRDAFLSELERQPSLMRQLIELLARRLLASTEREIALAFFSAPARLARVLLRLHSAQADQQPLRISQSNLALRTGISRQSVVVVLGQWRRQGWIQTTRNKISLLDLDVLHAIEREA